MRREMRGASLAATALALSASLLGCTPSASAPRESAAPAEEPPTSSPVEDLPAPTFTPSAGPLFWSCDAPPGGGALTLTVVQLNLDDGLFTDVFQAPLPEDQLMKNLRPCAAPHQLSGWAGERLFDPAFQRVAVSWGSYANERIGWVNANGQLVDATERISLRSDKLSSPQFDADGHFTFVDYDTGMLHRIDVTTFEDAVPEVQVFPVSTVDTLLLMPDESATMSWSLLDDWERPTELPLPSGRWHPPHTDGRITDVIGDDRVLLSAHSPTIVGYSVRWAAAEHVGTAATELPLLVQLSGAALHEAVTGGDLSTAVYHLDGFDESDTGIFRVALDGSSAPVKVADLSRGFTLFAWPEAP